MVKKLNANEESQISGGASKSNKNTRKNRKKARNNKKQNQTSVQTAPSSQKVDNNGQASQVFTGGIGNWKK